MARFRAAAQSQGPIASGLLSWEMASMAFTKTSCVRSSGIRTRDAGEKHRVDHRGVVPIERGRKRRDRREKRR